MVVVPGSHKRMPRSPWLPKTERFLMSTLLYFVASGPKMIARCATATCCLLIAVFMCIPAADAEPLCSYEHTYLGNHPDEANPGWHQDSQGLAHDSTHWYITQSKTMWRLPANQNLHYTSVRCEDDPAAELPFFTPAPCATMPSELSTPGYDHFGDISQHGGYVFVPIDGGDLPAVIAAFRADDTLEYVGAAEVVPNMESLGWLAIDPDGHLYASKTEAGHQAFYRFSVDWEKLNDESLSPEERLEITLDSRVLMLDELGNEVLLTRMQGGAFSDDGRQLYIVNGFLRLAKDTDNVADWGIHVFEMTLRQASSDCDGPDDECLPIGRRVDRSSRFRGDPYGFWFLFNVGLPYLEEPEGITFWDLDAPSAPDVTGTTSLGHPLSGQLHVILRDNDVAPLADHDAYIKHYRADVACELDSDLDEVGDGSDNCPDLANASQSDIDEDGIGDACDPDADGDGQSNADEELCGSDPLDAGDVSPDFDGDTILDCIDDDDDSDGQLDADEIACGSNPLDPGDVSPDFDVDGVLDCLDPDDDNDDVTDEDDRCPATLIPDPIIPASGVLKTNRYALMDGDLIFDRATVGNGEVVIYTTVDTGGCNASQITVAMSLGKSHYNYGITQSVLKAWIASQLP